MRPWRNARCVNCCFDPWIIRVHCMVLSYVFRTQGGKHIQVSSTARAPERACGFVPCLCSSEHSKTAQGNSMETRTSSDDVVFGAIPYTLFFTIRSLLLNV